MRAIEEARMQDAAAAEPRFEIVAGALCALIEGISEFPQNRRGTLSIWVFAALRRQFGAGIGAVQTPFERASEFAFSPGRVDGRRRGALLRRQRLSRGARRI